MTHYDLIVVGGGHAGIEASLASARLGLSTALLTHNRHEIGRMPCNPAIGGLGKGHLVKEIDALGGEMGLAIDQAGIHFRILNQRKGPAVQAPRAQADKLQYQELMSAVVCGQPGLDVIEADVEGLLSEGGPREARVVGVLLDDGREIMGDRVVLCTGTFLGGLMHVGEVKIDGGREGAGASVGLGGALAAAGFELMRLKTGTPPRLARDSIDYDRIDLQPGDENPAPFSFRTGDFNPDQINCHITFTNAETHEIIRRGLDRSPLFAGVIAGTGPRYCPSVEDKVVRFADKLRHFVFLEPEGRDSDEIYVNGLSTSLPRDVQEDVVHSIVGLEEAVLIRSGYAVEYDSVPSWQVHASLESKPLAGLYLAGQILGTSGYEEAAAQGLAAGINAARSLMGRPAVVFPRRECYMGVLIDDIVTKEITEPYRMFTSRAESRLFLRCDNVAARMLPLAEEIGLMNDEAMERLRAKVGAAARTVQFMKSARVRDPLNGATLSAAELLKRPNLNFLGLLGDNPELRTGLDGVHIKATGGVLSARDLAEAENQAFNDIRYEGYILRQDTLLQRQSHLDQLELPKDMDYNSLKALSNESREKLTRIRPDTIGQASRIDGVRQSDLAILTVMAQKLRNANGR